MSEAEPAEAYTLRTTPTVRSALAERLPPLADRFCARRGTYRIIYRVDDTTRTVTVVTALHALVGRRW